MSTLTDNEQMVLRLILRHQQRHAGASPTTREIARAMGWKSPASAAAIVRRLEAKGEIQRGSVRPALRITGARQTPDDRCLILELRALADTLHAPGAVARALQRAADRLAEVLQPEIS